jgi:Flp pilus assembly protein TadD
VSLDELGFKVVYVINFCEECGAKTDPSDKFCTGCGLFLARVMVDDSEPMSEQTDDRKLTAAIAQASITPTASNGPILNSTAPIKPHLVPTPVMPSNTRAAQSPIQNSSIESAAPKSYSMIVVCAMVAFVVLGGAGAYFIFRGGLSNEPAKVSKANSSQKKQIAEATSGEASKPLPAVTATGQMLIDASASGNLEEFQILLRQLQTRPLPTTVDRNLARSLNDEALKALNSDDPAAAIDLLKKASEADPADAEISNNLGYALRAAGKLKESEAQMIRTIEQFPARQQAWQDLGETYSKLGKHSQAVSSLLTAHRLAKNPGQILEKYSKILESTEDEGFKSDLTEAIKKLAELKQ